MKKNVRFNEELIEQFNSQEMVMLAGGVVPPAPAGTVLITIIRNILTTGNAICPEANHQNCDCNS